jgi:hypothetical protein
MKRLTLLFLGLVISACGSDGGGPTTPPTATQTRIIALTGDLNFGDVSVGGSADRTLRISNQGNAPMTVNSLTGPPGFAASWTNGTIQPNAGQDVNLRFSPTENRSYSGTLTVNANHTSGINTIGVNARGIRDPFMRSGSGNSVFDMPTDVTRVRIYGHWNGRGTSNFIVHIGGRSVVNAILRNGNPYEGVHLVTGGVVEIVSSENIDEWRFTEER